MSFESEFFLRKWVGGSAAKKGDDPLDSRQSQEQTARAEDIQLN